MDKSLSEIKIDMVAGLNRMAELRDKELASLEGHAEPDFISATKKLFAIADKLTELLKVCIDIDPRHPMVPELAITLSAVIFGITRNNITEEISLITALRDAKEKGEKPEFLN